MASSYPAGLDSFPTNRTDSTTSATNHPGDHNNLADAINKIEAELGVNPSGASYSTVAALLADAILKTIVDAKGDLLVGTADNTVARLAKGTDGHVLKANSATTSGLEWAAESGGGGGSSAEGIGLTTFYPEDYGALGDGTGDDTTAINNAINAAATARGVVEFKGYYRCAGTIVLKSGVALVGPYAHHRTTTTELTGFDGLNVPGTIFSSGADVDLVTGTDIMGVHMAGLRLRNEAVASASFRNILKLDGVWRSSFSDLYFHGSSTPDQKMVIDMTDCRECKFSGIRTLVGGLRMVGGRDNKFYDVNLFSPHQGFLIMGDSRRFYVTDCTIHSAGSHAFRVEEGRQGSYMGCKALNATEDGFRINSGQDIQVIGCTSLRDATTGGGSGFVVYTPDGFAAADIIFVGNRAVDEAGTKSQVYGGRLERSGTGTMDGITWVGNVFRDNLTGPYQELGTPSNVVKSGNNPSF